MIMDLIAVQTLILAWVRCHSCCLRCPASYRTLRRFIFRAIPLILTSSSVVVVRLYVLLLKMSIITLSLNGYFQNRIFTFAILSVYQSKYIHMQTCRAFERGGCDLSDVVEVNLGYFPAHLHNRLTNPNYHAPRYFACQTCHTSFVEYTVNIGTNGKQRTIAILGTANAQTNTTNWFNFNAWVGV